MYPHILDNIISYAPTKLLLALRACSHATRKKADNKLFFHARLVVRNHNLAVNPYGSYLRFAWESRPEARDSHRPAFPESASRDYIEERLLSARIIDPPLDIDCNRLSAIIGKAPMVRLSAWRSRMAAVSHVPTVWTYKIHSDLQVSYRTERRKVIATPLLYRGRLSKPHAIVHLLNGDGTSRQSLRPLLSVLRCLIIYSSQVTVVGGSDACCLALGLLEGPITHDMMLDELFSCLGDADIDLQCPREACRFISPAEYAAEVGAMQVAIETRDGPFSGKTVYAF
jgi:hypothetical protein